MKQFSIKIVLLAGCLILGSIVFVVAKEDPFARISYPLAELGNCSDKNDCAVYCEEPENRETCLDFAETHGLLSEKEIESAQRMLALGETEGPGGCRGLENCEAFCDQIENIKECIVFAEENNLIPQEELDEARKVVQAIDRGLTPPKCEGKQECEVYCSRPENMEECIVFAREAGLMPPEEVEEAEKVLRAIKAGAKPPACAGKEQCDLYCSQSEHMEECLEFGIAAGFIPPEEIEGARGALRAIKQGIKPPNCQGRQECDSYCSQAEHMEECLTFAIAAGFMPPEEIENTKKTLQAIRQGIMPPNCRGEEECDVYCSQEEHRQECFDFAVAAGFMTQEEIERAQKGGQGGPGPSECQYPEQCEQQFSGQEGEFIPPGEQQPGPEVFPEQMPLPEQSEPVPLLPILPEELPQSILKVVRYFLANISSVFQR